MTTARYARTLLFSLFLFLIACHTSKEEFKDLTSLTGGKTFAVPSGTVADQFVLQRFSDAHFAYFNSVYDCALAVTAGKADAAVYDLPVLKNIAGKDPGLYVINEILVPDHYGFAVGKGETALKLAIDETLQSLREDGLYDEMLKRWLPEDGPPGEMPEITVAEEGEPLVFGTAAVTEPMAFVRTGGEITGFDIEFAMRIAAHLKRPLKVVNMEFGAMLPALISGKVDMIGAGLSITEERAKQVLFSESYYAGGLAALVKASSAPASLEEEAMVELPAHPQHMAVLEDMQGRKVGVLTGTVHDAWLQEHHPQAIVLRFSNIPDMILSLQSGKADAIMLDRSTAMLILGKNDNLGLFSDDVLELPLGIGFHKQNPDLRITFNQYLVVVRENGVYDALYQKWFEEDAEMAEMPEFTYPEDGKVLNVGVSVNDLPYVAVKEGRYVGFDIELISGFAAFAGYTPRFHTLEFSSLIAALSSGKVDMIADGMAITEERAEKIAFSDEYVRFRTAVIAKKADLAAYAVIGDTEDPVGSGFWASLVDGVERNLLKEKRYLMILKGLWVTLLITILAAFSGTLLGGGVCFMRMSEKKWLSNPARSFISLIRGTPVLVLLMIIYYVIFSSVNINAVLVAVIAFGINFAAYVSEMFRSGIESVDHGQKEAGIASGFSPVQTFIHIIAPQALRRILPVYKGEFISLLKMTSVVGYIAVEDLTKASDIIRSRTFDAFFPLLLAAAIYIILAWVLALMLDRMEISVNPLKRTQKRLKKAAV
jgi:polar amino acid transport system substrate-binding protein